MTDEQIAYSLAKMKEFGIVDSGDDEGQGRRRHDRRAHESFFDKMVKAGLFPADLDYKKSYTLQFVNKNVGADLTNREPELRPARRPLSVKPMA